MCIRFQSANPYAKQFAKRGVRLNGEVSDGTFVERSAERSVSAGGGALGVC